MWIFVPILFIAGAAVLFYSFAVFDRLVRAQYESYREAWIADGRPRGFFWRAPECTWLRSALALHRVAVTWLFKSPPWTTESATCRALLRRLRMSVLAWHAIIVAGLILFISTLT